MLSTDVRFLELQDLSKLEAGYAMLDKTLINFRDYFADLDMLLEAEAESRNMTLEVHCKSLLFCSSCAIVLKERDKSPISSVLKMGSGG
mgnify:CR=1 FL=1